MSLPRADPPPSKGATEQRVPRHAQCGLRLPPAQAQGPRGRVRRAAAHAQPDGPRRAAARAAARAVTRCLRCERLAAATGTQPRAPGQGKPSEAARRRGSKGARLQNVPSSAWPVEAAVPTAAPARSRSRRAAAATARPPRLPPPHPERTHTAPFRIRRREPGARESYPGRIRSARPGRGRRRGRTAAARPRASGRGRRRRHPAQRARAGDARGAGGAPAVLLAGRLQPERRAPRHVCLHGAGSSRGCGARASMAMHARAFRATRRAATRAAPSAA